MSSAIHLALILLFQNTIQSDTLIAKITDIPIGKFLMDQAMEIGFQTLNSEGQNIEVKALFDNDLSTSIKFQSNQQIVFYLDRKHGKTPYPCEGFYITNGNSSNNPNRIKILEITIKIRRMRKAFYYMLNDTIQFQYIEFPMPVFLGKNSEIQIKAIENYYSNGVGEISEFAIEFE